MVLEFNVRITNTEQCTKREAKALCCYLLIRLSETLADEKEKGNETNDRDA